VLILTIVCWESTTSNRPSKGGNREEEKDYEPNHSKTFVCTGFSSKQVDAVAVMTRLSVAMVRPFAPSERRALSESTLIK
jgi:hypothetical protein